ncbi:hypothetical protein [Helicobacter sp. T3_23-1059]
MKKVALSGALAALVALPALGIEVYNNEEKDASVNIYGSLRGFLGGSGNLGNIGQANYEQSSNKGNFLIGFQTNSHFGIDTKYGKLTTKVEFGLSENNFLGSTDSPTDANAFRPGLRKVYGTYDFGSGGKLTFGKLDTPTIEGGFQTNFANNDAGGNGFGSITTGSRKLQVQYEHSGAKVAIIADEAKAGSSAATAYTQSYGVNTRLQTFPRIALSYESKLGDKGKLKAGITYKYYANRGNTNNVHAGHLLVGAKFGVGGDSTLSTFFHYGINGHLYGEQQTAQNTGLYGYDSKAINAGIWAQRAGLLFEFGTKLNDTLSLAAGAGYQATFNGVGSERENYHSGQNQIHGYQVYANLPINVAKGFQVVPQLAFYDTIQTYRGAKATHKSALVGLLRLKYDF